MARLRSFDKSKAFTMVFPGSDYTKVSTFFDYLDQGKSLDAFLKDFPSVRREQATAKLAEALELLYERMAVDVERRNPGANKSGSKTTSESKTTPESKTASEPTTIPKSLPLPPPTPRGVRDTPAEVVELYREQATRDVVLRLTERDHAYLHQRAAEGGFGSLQVYLNYLLLVSEQIIENRLQGLPPFGPSLAVPGLNMNAFTQNVTLNQRYVWLKLFLDETFFDTEPLEWVPTPEAAKSNQAAPDAADEAGTGEDGVAKGEAGEEKGG